MISMEVVEKNYSKKNFSVSFPQGRTLSVLSNTQLQIDPDLTIAHDLRKWYLEEGMNVEMTDLTIQTTNHENGELLIKTLLYLFDLISFMEDIFSSNRI
jgi:hypothetical protein